MKFSIILIILGLSACSSKLAYNKNTGCIERWNHTQTTVGFQVAQEERAPTLRRSGGLVFSQNNDRTRYGVGVTAVFRKETQCPSLRHNREIIRRNK